MQLDNISHIRGIGLAILIGSLLVAVCILYAIILNSQRSDADPEKREYRPGAVLLVFFTWPILLPMIVSLFILRTLLYGFFLILFTLCLIIMPRARPRLSWLEKKFARIGEILLQANTALLDLFLRPPADEPA